jgi:DNA recombination protein RmuC
MSINEIIWLAVGLVVGLVFSALIFLAGANKLKAAAAESEADFLKQKSELDRKIAESTPKLERLARLEEDVVTIQNQLRESESKAATEESKASERLRELENRRQRLEQLERDLNAKTEIITQFETDKARLQSQMKAAQDNLEEQKNLLREAEFKFKDAFTALSSEALKSSQDQFLKSSQEILKQYTEGAKNEFGKKSEEFGKLLDPLKEKLGELDKQNQEMEKSRASAYSELKQQVTQLSSQQVDLTKETSRLVKALQDPGTAGSWGEMLLEKVVEMAGLPEGIIFELQESTTTEEGRQRPDMAIRLPGDRCLIVDSKAPLKGYLDALESEDETIKAGLLKELPRKLLGHAQELKKRSYDKRVETPDFTVMFIPSESAFRVALEQRPGLIEEVIDLRVIMATPSTMLALLKVVAYGWRQDKLTQTAKEVQEQAQRLYETVVTLMGHYEKLGRALGSAGKAYNEFGSSLNSRVVPAARKFRDFGISAKNEVSESELIEFAPRPLVAPDFQSKNALPAGDTGLFGEEEE